MLRVVLAQLIIAAALVWFLLTFTVLPLHSDPYCTKSHGIFTFAADLDLRFGWNSRYEFAKVCDEYKPLPVESAGSR